MIPRIQRRRYSTCRRSLNFVTFIPAADEIDIAGGEASLILERVSQWGYLEATQQRTADREHLPTADETHSNAHDTPTEDESEKIGSPDLANKQKIEQEVTVK